MVMMKKLLILLVAILCFGSAAAIEISNPSLGGPRQSRGATVSDIIFITNNEGVELTNITLTRNASSEYRITLSNVPETLAAGQRAIIQLNGYVPQSAKSGINDIGTITVTALKTIEQGVDQPQQTVPVELTAQSICNADSTNSNLPVLGKWFSGPGFCDGNSEIKVGVLETAFDAGWAQLHGSNDFWIGTTHEDCGGQAQQIPEGMVSGGKIHSGPYACDGTSSLPNGEDSGWVEVAYKPSAGRLLFVATETECSDKGETEDLPEGSIVLGKIHTEGLNQCSYFPGGISHSGKKIYTGWMSLVYAPAIEVPEEPDTSEPETEDSTDPAPTNNTSDDTASNNQTSTDTDSEDNDTTNPAGETADDTQDGSDDSEVIQPTLTTVEVTGTASIMLEVAPGDSESSDDEADDSSDETSDSNSSDDSDSTSDSDTDDSSSESDDTTSDTQDDSSDQQDDSSDDSGQDSISLGGGAVDNDSSDNDESSNDTQDNQEDSILEITRVKLDCGDSERVEKGDKIKEIAPGSSCSLLVNIENTDTEEDLDDVEIELESESRDVEEVSESIKSLNAEDKEQIELKFTIDEDADEDDVELTLTVKGEDEDNDEHEVEFKFEIEIEKPAYDIRIASIEARPEEIKVCDAELVDIRVRLENKGRNDAEAAVRIKVPSINYEKKREDISISEDDDRVVTFSVPVSTSTSVGSYLVQATSYYENTVETATEFITFKVLKCETQKTTSTTTPKATPRVKPPVQSTVVVQQDTAVAELVEEETFADSAIYTGMLIGGNLIVITLLGLMTFALSSRKPKKPRGKQVMVKGQALDNYY